MQSTTMRTASLLNRNMQISTPPLNLNLFTDWHEIMHGWIYRRHLRVIRVWLKFGGYVGSLGTYVKSTLLGLFLIFFPFATHTCWTVQLISTFYGSNVVRRRDKMPFGVALAQNLVKESIFLPQKCQWFDWESENAWRFSGTYWRRIETSVIYLKPRDLRLGKNSLVKKNWRKMR